MASREGVNRVKSLVRAVGAASCRCPAHSQQNYAGKNNYTSGSNTTTTDYAVEMACSSIRYGNGVTKEVGMDFDNMSAKNVCIMTDENLARLPVMQTVLDSMSKAKIQFDVFDEVRIEPTDTSFKSAIDYAKRGDFDAYLAVGGGSVMDTCKAANLYATNPEADFLDYVNTPLGKGLPVMHQLKPMVAIPTTSGTGSETTGTSIFDLESAKAKTGIANRALRPTLGLVDPLHALTMPERVAAFSGFDVLCHALESYTAIPYQERSPCPENPKFRPAYQGSNPISDVWSKHALAMVAKYFKRSVNNCDDIEARSQMHLASAFAGIGFGNAGVHLCHGFSYAISGNIKSLADPYKSKDYDQDKPLVPHGLSVVIPSPAVFNFTYTMCPDRHLEAAGILGADISNAKREDAGRILGDVLRKYMYDLKVEDGLKALGYDSQHIPSLVQGTLPQHRVNKLAPRPQTEEDLTRMLEDSLTVYN